MTVKVRNCALLSSLASGGYLYYQMEGKSKLEILLEDLEQGSATF